MQVYDYQPGRAPLLVSMPHCGTVIPADIAATMTPAALELADTDWHVDRLYDFAGELGASLIRPVCSRYVIDLNRPPDNSNLYPGADSTGLCPLSDFERRPLYRDGSGPDADEVERRLETWWRPYHDRLRSALAEMVEAHGVALLFDAHSIRSRVPRLFDGALPDLNIGSADGSSCAASLRDRVVGLLQGQDRFSHVVDGRFKGGYITRAYGNPSGGVHALQLELAQCLYMRETLPFDYLPEHAAELQPQLRALLAGIIDWAQAEAGRT